MQSANFGSFSNDPAVGVALPSSSLETYPDLGTSPNLSATLSLSTGAAYQDLTPIQRQASPLRETLRPFLGPDSLLGAGTGALYSRSTNQPRLVRTILGTARRDTINTVNRAVAVGDRLQILARGSNDSIKVGRRTSAYGETGNDVLDARLGRGGNFLYGNAGADTLYARSTDVLLGGDGNDNLWAGLGRNRLTGGTGSDRFWLGNGRFPTAINTITDFRPGTDLLMIRNLPGVRSFADLSFVQRGTGTRVFAAGRAIADVLGVVPSRLSAANFRIFTNDPPVPAPSITASLVTDTGASATDGITQTASITGQVAGTRLSRFEIKADNGSFVDFTSQLSNGQFSLSSETLATLSGGTLSNGQHTLQFRATNDQNTVTLQNFTFTLDTVAPGNPTFNAPGVTASSTTPYTFTVTYTDDQAIQVGSLGDGDVRVTGPGNYSQSATLVSVEPNTDGATRTATYQIIPPGNGWDLADNGLYTIEVLANQVSDVAGNSLAASTLGTFGVNIPLNLNVGLTADTGASNSDRITTNAGITGSIQGSGFNTLQISVNNGAFQNVTGSVTNGNFAFTAAQLATFNGGALPGGANTIVLRATTAQNAVTEQTLNFTLDTAAPTATASASSVTAAGDTYTFTVTFNDDNGVDVSTLANGDVRVTGPNGFNQPANLVSVDLDTDGTPRTATFQLTPPGGTWNLADNGTYSVQLVASSVADIAGNQNAAATLGSFTVDFAPAPTLAVGLTSDTGVSNSDGLTNTVGVTGQVGGSNLSQLQVRVDNGNFVDVTSALNLNTGAFTLTSAEVIAAATSGTLADGAHTLTFRVTNNQGSSTDSNLNFTLNRAAPTATGNAANVSATGNAYTFTVTFSDDNAVDIATLGNGDVRVTGPNNFNQTATLVSVDVNSNGTPRTATYQIIPPGGSWDQADNGTYTVELLANQVSDTAGNQNAIATLDTFTVNLAAPPTVTVGLTSDTGTSNTDGLTNSAGVTGQTNGGVTQLQVRLDNGNFVDVTSALNVNTGAYSLTSAQVIAAAGGALANGAHTLTIRATNGLGSVDSNLNFTFDTQAPQVQVASAANAIATGGANYTFTITFRDGQAIDAATLGNGDVLVTGPNGFSQAATFLSVNTSGNGTPRTATYQIAVPGGSWNFAENGLYTISLAADQVRDTAGNAIAAGTAGYFSVLVPSRINFQPTATTAPTGYTIDSGLGFDATRGYGWVTQGTNTALDISSRVFDRAAANIETRLDTVALMQSSGTAAATAAAWEYTLANGRYSVTVSVGDSAGGSNHIIRAEGTTVVPTFNTTTTGGVPSYFKLATATVDVIDGRLTIDAVGGTDTRINYIEIVPITPGDHPSVLSSPLANATNVNRRAAINISDLNLFGVGEGVDGATLTSATIQIYRTRDGAVVASNFNTSGGNDTIIIQPQNQLDANTQYTVRISDGVKDLGGRTFVPYSLTFTTGNDATTPTDGVSFTQSLVFGQNTSNDAPISTLLMSPDNRFLYGSALDGNIHRWTVQADGTLSGQQTFTMPRGTLSNAPELIGIAFDPNNPNVLWVAQNTATGTSDAVDFSSKIVRLTLTGGDAAFTATAQDYVVGLPRSGRDHFSNSLRFGPDGRLYLTQGSNTSAGVADGAWGMRNEHLLTAAMLQIDTSLINNPGFVPINVQTNDQNPSAGYNPYAVDAPVKIYASGLRNSYDFVFHSNGTLYAPVNGSGGGGITPDDPNTAANEGLTNVSSRPDYVYRIIEGEYYGHPNPSRGEYIMAGGNPTAGVDPQEVAGTAGVSGYPVGTQPDPDYQTALFTFGTSRAPTGVLEYQSDTFNGRLKNRLIVTEYSSGDDIVVLEIDPTTGNITGSSILGGGSVNPDWGMANPVDIVENTSNGNLYVAELYPQGFGPTAVLGRIRLVRPA